VVDRAEDVSAALQERIRAFTSFYEQHAYLAYNLALRIACEPESAMRAVGRGFLSQVSERPVGLVPATVNAALKDAPSKPTPAGGGDAEAERMLAAVAELAAPERAALALADLADAGPDAIGAALGLDADQASKLLHRGREGFAARLGLPRAQADEAARDWLWAAPPNEIWEELYPRFHSTAERQVRRGHAEDTLALGVGGPSEEGVELAPVRRRRRPGAAVVGGRFRWSRRTRWELILPAAALVALGGAAATRLADRETRGGEGVPSSAPFDGGGVPGAAGSGASGTEGAGTRKSRQPLTPEQLDKLRLRELEQLSRYTRRQANRRLSTDDRAAAERGIRALRRAAERRLRAQQRREDVLREQLARERARSNAPPPPPAPRTRAPSRRAPSQTRQGPAPGSAPSTGERTQETCLLQEETGEYICPE
jgi:hypothetical protein